MQGGDTARSRSWEKEARPPRRLRLYFQRPVTLAFPRVLELQEKQGPVRQDAGQPSMVGRWGGWGAAEGCQGQGATWSCLQRLNRAAVSGGGSSLTLQERRKGWEAWETGRRGEGARGGWSSDAHTFWLSLILLRRTLICKKRRKERVTPPAPTRLRTRLAWGRGGQDQRAEPLSCLASRTPH